MNSRSFSRPVVEERTQPDGAEFMKGMFVVVTSTIHEPDLLTVDQTRYRLGIGRTKFYELLNSGELPFRRIRLGEHLRFSRLEVERYCHGELAGNRTDDATEAA